MFTLLFFAQAAASTPAPPPASFETEFRRGLMALQRNDPGAAQQSLERALQLKPENAQAWAALAQAYLRGKQPKPATDAAQRAEQLGAADPVTEHALAIFYSEARDLPKAADWERRFAASPIADPNAAARAAALSLDAGDPQQAITWAKKALERKDSAEVHHLLANAYEAAKQPDAALDEFRNAARLAPDDEAFTFDFGNCVLRRGDFSAALGIFDEARRRFAKSAQVELAYGVAAYGARQFPDAIASFLHVTEIDPSVEQPYVFMGRILDQGGERLPRIVAAYAAWEKANPESYLPPLLRAKAMSASAGDAAAIEAELRGSIKLNGDYWESHLELGIVLAKKRQWQDAAVELLRSIELNPKEPRAHFQLARVYDRLGERAKAEAERAIHEQLSASETDVHGAKEPIKP